MTNFKSNLFHGTEENLIKFQLFLNFQNNSEGLVVKDHNQHNKDTKAF